MLNNSEIKVPVTENHFIENGDIDLEFEVLENPKPIEKTPSKVTEVPKKKPWNWKFWQSEIQP